MKLDKIPQNTAAKRVGLPRYYPGGKTAVLVLHGFGGFTEELDYLAQRINQAGYTVSLPRLPGHGTCGDDFYQTGWKDWLRRFTDAYLDLRAAHETVYVAGLSMGGVIALLLASRFPIPRLALAAPAVVNREKIILLTPLVQFFAKKMATGYTEERRDPEIQEMAKDYWCNNWPRQAASLLRLQRMARRRLSKVTADTFTIVSEADNRVPVSAAELVEKGISGKKAESLILQNSPHVMVDGCDKELIADRIIQWFDQGSQDQGSQDQGSQN